MKQDYNPRSIALILSAVLGAFFMLVLFVFVPAEQKLWILLITFIFLVLAYFLSLFLIQNFVYKKIKLIYKTIHSLKSRKGTQENGMFLKHDLLDNVKSDVAEWAADQEKQMTILREQEKFRKEFLANISHELKTPIFSIQGYLHTLLDGAIEDEKVNLKFIQKAANNADRLQDLVEDLLAISKIEKGDLALTPVSFDISKLCKDVWDSIEVLNEEKQIDFQIKNGNDPSFFVNADKEGIRKVLENLFSNSIKYGKQKGTTLVSFYEMGNHILIEIKDNGEGIDEKDLPRLFERFYRAEKSRSREMGGTGLGLSIVKHIIESHQQTINVRSAIGIGTTFGFTLSKDR